MTPRNLTASIAGAVLFAASFAYVAWQSRSCCSREDLAPRPAEPETFPLASTGTKTGIAGNTSGTGNASAAPKDFGFRGTTLLSRMAPPDPHIAAGPGHIVLITNEQIAFYTKDGKETFRQLIRGSTGLWGTLGNIPRLFDPEVHWDPHARRFYAFACGRSSSVSAGQSYFMLAVSDDQDPNGTWHRFRFDVTALASVNNGGAGDIDSPNLGFDKDVMYMSADFQFGGAGARHLIYMVEKAPLLTGKQPQKTGNILRMGTRFWGMASIRGTTALAMFCLEHLASSQNSANKIRLHAIRSPLNKPTLTSIDISVPTYAWPGNITAQGSQVRIGARDPRFWGAPVWQNGSLWCCHHVGSPVKARWYEIKTNAWPIAGAPTVAQMGTVDMGSARHTFFNAINVDAAGNALMVFTMCSTSDYLSIGRAWRKADDPKGTMRPAQIVQANTAPYSVFRWGDYGAATPDPVEPRTMWYAHEYARHPERLDHVGSARRS